MENQILFQQRLKQALEQIGEEILSYDEGEFWMIRSQYDYLEYYAAQKQLLNMAIALPLARGIHNGAHRKAKITRNGNSYHLPYLIHCLSVCKMLADMQLNLSAEEEDICLAAALCHDMIEDVPFPEKGKELYQIYQLDPRVYETVLLVSKNRDATPEEEAAHFQHIAENKLSLLVKLSDRGNNIEDLYNRSCWKVHEYVGETRKYFLPMIDFGLKHFPELTDAFEIFTDKINTLTQIAKVLVERYEKKEQEMEKRLEELKQENERLRQEWKQLWRKEV